jgi:hypothetical protein
MRQRVGQMNRDLRDIIRKAQRSNTITSDVAQFGMELIARVQIMTVDFPVWLGSYKAGIEEMELTEEQAARFADSVVRQSQAGGTKLDQSAFERGGRGGSEFLKVSTLFYSYNNVVLQQLREAGRMTKSIRDVPAFLASYWMYAVMPAVMSAAIYAITKGRYPDPDEDDFDEQMQKEAFRILVGDAAATVPFVRDAWPVLAGERPRSASGVEVFYREITDLRKPTDGMDLLFDLLRVGALTAGWPGDRPLRLAEDVLRGEEE